VREGVVALLLPLPQGQQLRQRWGWLLARRRAEGHQTGGRVRAQAELRVLRAIAVGGGGPAARGAAPRVLDGVLGLEDARLRGRVPAQELQELGVDAADRAPCRGGACAGRAGKEAG